MELQTKVAIGNLGFRLDYNSPIMMLGSCFTENMGAKLNYYKFNVDVNPCGIAYNPGSIANALRLLLDERNLMAEELMWNAGKWISLYHHGSFSFPGQKETLQNINQRLTDSAQRLKQTGILLLTFGTAWVYKHRERDMIASNCHKLPAKDFERFRLTVSDIVDEYDVLLSRLQKMNPELKIIFTVSPIRHWKDGAEENQLSKATLLLVIDELKRKHQNVTYFPSYEIVMDELRDYRFYAEDMLHISSVAIDYIWEKFKSACVTSEIEELMKKVDKINRGVTHRPFSQDSPDYKEMLKKILLEIETVEQMDQHIRFHEEKIELNRRLLL